MNLEDGNLYEFSSEEMGYFYRGHSLKGRWIFIEAEFKGVSSEYELILQRLKEVIDKKNKKSTSKRKNCWLYIQKIQ